MVSLSERNREEVIEQNMGLVHSCAHRFKGRGIEYDDLFQAGCIGHTSQQLGRISGLSS